jgi:hypothetical protein
MHRSRLARTWSLAILLAALAGSADLGSNVEVRSALKGISAASLAGHVEFLSSDLLEGRGTPSRGLDVAAQYVAAQFRRAGLEPIGDEGYFQSAPFLTFDSEQSLTKFELITGGKRLIAAAGGARATVTGPLSLTGVTVRKFAAGDQEKLDKLTRGDVQGQAIAIYLRSRFDRDGMRLQSAARRLRPALIILAGPGAAGPGRPRLVAGDLRAAEIPVIGIGEGDVATAMEQAASETEMKVTVTCGAPKETAFVLRNVAGLLRGSDPSLKDTYILVTGHYDHMGVRATGEGDRIYNGANDDASGTASVMEIASALAGMPTRPKRSILFIALFGEEMGLLGSQYYGRHPLVPLARTIADVNLEQLGRTDATGGPQVATATFTGFGFSDLPATFAKAGEQVGVKVYGDEKRGDAYFARSDNQALADVGIPAHTLCVAYEYPDYHALRDEWQKIDYENMALVDRMVALGLMMLSESGTPPKWNVGETKTKRYVDAWNALHTAGR